jgi:hypothetical protein
LPTLFQNSPGVAPGSFAVTGLMIKIVKKHVREVRKFAREEARRNDVHLYRVDDALEQISLQKKGLAKENK